jgi:hypothetical protein
MEGQAYGPLWQIDDGKGGPGRDPHPSADGASAAQVRPKVAREDSAGFSLGGACGG